MAVLLPEGPGTTGSMVVDTLELNRAAEDLHQHCVQRSGSGGKFHQTSDRAEGVTELPDIVMYAPKSKWGDFLEVKYQCHVNPKGARCKSSPRPIPRTKGGAYGTWRYMGTIGKQGWTKLPPSKDSNKRKCGGSCLNPQDCDIDSDCLCASTKGD